MYSNPRPTPPLATGEASRDANVRRAAEAGAAEGGARRAFAGTYIDIDR